MFQVATSVVRTHAKLQVIRSINSLFTSYLKLTCQSIFFNMEKMEYRAVITFFVVKGSKAKTMSEQLLDVYKEFSPSKRTVEFWAGEF